MAITVAGADYNSVTPEAMLLEAAQKVSAYEAITANNPDGDNNVSLSFNGDNNLMTITATIPCTTSVDANGKIVVEADPYLVD